MYDNIKKIAETATLLDSMGETKLANQLDQLIEKLAADPVAVLKDLTPADISSALLGNATMSNGIDLLQEFKTRELWNGQRPRAAEVPTVAKEIFRGIQALPAPAPRANQTQNQNAPAAATTTAPQQSKEHDKKTKAGPHKGMQQVQQLMNQWLKKNKPDAGQLDPNGNQGDQPTWKAIKDNLLLIPGRDFKNYQELAAKIQEFIARPVAQPKQPWKVPPRRDVPPAQDRGADVMPDGSLRLKNTDPAQPAAPKAPVNATTFEGDRDQYERVEMPPNRKYLVHSEKGGQGYVINYYKIPADMSGSLTKVKKVRHTAKA